MDSLVVQNTQIRTGWSAVLSRAVAALLLFEVISGLAITFGPFHPAVEWGVLLHTIMGFVMVAPLAWYFVRHWSDYTGQALSDVLLLGYLGFGSLAVCVVSGLLVTGQAVFGIRTSPALRYVHLVSTLLALAATIPHIFIAWLRRHRSGLAKGAERIVELPLLAFRTMQNRPNSLFRFGGVPPLTDGLVALHGYPGHVNRVLRADADAMLFASAFVGARQHRHTRFEFEAGRSAGRDTQVAARAQLLDHYRNPFATH